MFLKTSKAFLDLMPIFLFVMSRLCELTGTKTQFGNNVSHSQRKTRRTFLPNIQSMSFFSDSMKRRFTFKAIASSARSIEKVGGIDVYLLSVKENKLSRFALAIKKVLKKLVIVKNAEGLS